MGITKNKIMATPELTSLGQTFNEGIGSGSFAASITIGGFTGSYVFDPFVASPEVLIIKRKSALGVSLAKQGIKVDATATSTVQVAFTTDATPLPVWLPEGAYFQDPDGDWWWVSEAPKERRSGDTFKQNVKCELRLTTT